MIVKYLRVSTKHQDVLRQDMQLDKLNINFDKEYIDKITGKTKDRPQLLKMIKEVKHGDIVYCESISRLGRSLKDLIEIIDTLVAKGVQVKIIKEGIDTSTSTYKLLLAIFGAVAEMERETIQERVQQGVDKCKATGKTKTGKWFGREEKKKDDLPKDFKKYYDKMKNKEISKVEMAKLLEVGRATVYRWIKIYEDK
ncbi:recombinase family protein [Clostridium massiliodielmoense]|uniref:recombinase family protein n=1 Tax=Clostridium massiliodielmoense TaxID=1776385 RepID=UPI000A26C232|nr:recombinase family protein [Clostridium massiliodielmoense]